MLYMVTVTQNRIVKRYYVECAEDDDPIAKFKRCCLVPESASIVVDRLEYTKPSQEEDSIDADVSG